MDSTILGFKDPWIQPHSYSMAIEFHNLDFDDPWIQCSLGSKSLNSTNLILKYDPYINTFVAAEASATLNSTQLPDWIA